MPWQQIRNALGAFMHRYGADRQVAIVRSPGRINLMGRHIDHQGGTVNVMAVNREIILVAAPRTDDVVSLANTEGAQFSEETFRISDLVASLNWDDWQRVIDGPRLQRLLDAARGDWANYVKAAILRLQELFRDRRLRGLDMMVSGDIPMGAGLSSSSALVVATAEAVRVFNRLPVSARRLVSLCGEGEWFVGTRGGAADHAAIRLSHRGCVTRVGFFPFRIEDSARFFPGHDLVACNSGIYAGKSREARNTFNAKVTAYHIGRVWFKMLRPDLAPADRAPARHQPGAPRLEPRRVRPVALPIAGAHHAHEGPGGVRADGRGGARPAGAAVPEPRSARRRLRGPGGGLVRIVGDGAGPALPGTAEAERRAWPGAVDEHLARRRPRLARDLAQHLAAGVGRAAPTDR